MKRRTFRLLVLLLPLLFSLLLCVTVVGLMRATTAQASPSSNDARHPFALASITDQDIVRPQPDANGNSATIIHTKTVGVSPTGCATSSTLTVMQGADVYYCYAVTNNGRVTLTLHTIDDSDLGAVRTSYHYTLTPGASSYITQAATAVITTTNIATWTAFYSAAQAISSVSDVTSATLNVIPLRPAIQFTKTVGLVPGSCATGDSLIVIQGTPVIYCYKVMNTGNVTLTLHSLTDNQLGSILNNSAQTLAPQASTFITRNTTAVITTTNVATWTAYISATNGLKAEATDSATVNVLPLRPAIQFTKTVGLVAGTCATGDSLTVMQGTPVIYCYNVMNTGNVTLTLHRLTDDKLGSILNNQALALAPQASMFITRSASAVITTTNVATWTAYISATNGLKAEATDIAIVNVIPLRLAIQFTKTVGLVAGTCATGDSLTVMQGTLVVYCYEVKNTGNVTLTLHSLIDNQLGSILNNSAQTLAPQASTFITRSTTAMITTTNVATWTAYVSSTNGLKAVATDSATVNVIPLRPAIQFTKTVGLVPGSCATGDSLTVMQGKSVVYCYEVMNTGNITLALHTLTDNELGSILSNQALALAPQASTLITRAATAAITSTNVATWTAYISATTGLKAVATDSATVNVIPLHPAIQFTKTVGTSPFACAAGDSLTVMQGKSVVYCYEVMNTGNVTLTIHSLTDDKLGSILSSQTLALAPQASTFITRSATAVITTTNVATWTAYISATNGLKAEATDSATVNVIPLRPAIQFTKTVGSAPSVCAASNSVTLIQGESAVYCYQVRNTGNVSLTLHVLTDSALGSIVSGIPYTLSPGASTFVIHGAAPLITTTNVATWTAYVTASNGLKAEAIDSATVNVIPLRPAIQFTKTVGTSPSTCAAGDSLTVMQGTKIVYCYKVKNTGNVTLTIHSLTDNKLGAVLTNHPLALAPQASTFITRSATAVITTTNIATWTAYVSSTNGLKAVATDIATVNVIPLRPAIQFTKTVGLVPNACAAGDSLTVMQGTKIVYCYKVKNTGNVTLTLHNLTDSKLGAILNNQALALAPQASTFITRSATAVITTTNVATWTAYVSSTSGLKVVAIDSAIVNVIPLRPAIQFTKTVGLASGACATGDAVTVMQGTSVFYCYRVKNVGNVTLALHSLTDNKLGSILSSQALALAPQASTFITRAATAVITTTNVATWTAHISASNGLKAVATDNATVNVILFRPTIQFTKTVGTVKGTCAVTSEIVVSGGTTVYYCYSIKNTGNVTLTHHQLTDLNIDQDILPAGFTYDLPPGERVSTVEMGVIISARIDTTTTNTAIWNAYREDNEDVYAVAIAKATVRVRRASISVTKSVGNNQNSCSTGATLVVKPLSSVYYCLTLKNTGSLTLTQHNIKDLALGINRNVNLSIAPGATVVFTRARMAELGPILVTQDITNTMSAASSYVDGPAKVTISATTTALVLIDSDQDTIPDRIEGTGDLDGDSNANHRDTDADGDGVSDQAEAGPDPLHPHQTVTGVPDFLNPFVPNGGIYLPIIQR